MLLFMTMVCKDKEAKDTAYNSRVGYAITSGLLC